MASHIRPSSLLLFISSLLAVTEGHTRAKLVLQERATYNGGWALGIPGSTCPSIAPVACDTGDSTVNPNCCPSGQTCLGLIDPYCCPTDVDCHNVVSNLPVCANSTWNMYELDLNEETFFCCEPGQYGVLPVSGYAGICEPNDQPVASSLIATAATQIGGAVATGTGNVVVATTAVASTLTSTLVGGGLTTIRTTIAATTTQTSGSSATGGASSSSPIQSAAKTWGLSVGAIIGIAVGALGLILLALVSCFLCWKKRRTQHPGQTPAPVYSAVPQPYQRQNLVPAEYKSPPVAYAAPVQGYGGHPQPGQGHAVSPLSSQAPSGYGGSPPPQGYGPSQPPTAPGGPPPVEAPQRWEGRVEMG